MGLDINLFRADKGFDPEVVRESQRRRFQPPETVDEIIQLDNDWKKGNSISVSLLSLFSLYTL
jgi:seryl-tRNA synthetase